MKTLILISAIAGTLFLVSCSNEKNKSTTDGNSSELPMVDPATVNAPVTDPANQTQAAEVAPANAAAAIPAGSTPAGINPPHGEPGHDCGIAVGAPLNSPRNPVSAEAPAMINATPNGDVQTITMPSTPNTGAPQVIQAAPASGPTPAGMNPPHGEPGHDCSIAVGAPLKK